MGVPSFFRWLVKKYPGILERCVAVRDGGYVNATLRTTTETGEAAVPKLTMQHYPMDYDNLYLDMYDFFFHFGLVVACGNLTLCSV
jgi:5'-3' exonuclease